MKDKVLFTAGVWINEKGIVVGEDKDNEINEVVFFRVRPDKNPDLELCVKPNEITEWLD